MPNTGNLTGLTAGTEYILDAVHVDASGNVSAVVSSSAFTTDAAASATMPDFDQSYTPSASGAVYTQAGLALGTGDFVVGVAYQSSGSGQTISSMVIDGQTITPTESVTDIGASGVALYRVTTTNATWDIVLTMSGAVSQGMEFFVWGAGSNTALVDSASSSGVADLDPPISQNVDTETGGKVIGVASCLVITAYDNLTGVSLVAGSPVDVDTNDRVAAFDADVTTGETPRTVSIGGDGGVRHAIAVISLGAA